MQISVPLDKVTANILVGRIGLQEIKVLLDEAYPSANEDEELLRGNFFKMIDAQLALLEGLITGEVEGSLVNPQEN